MDWLNPQPHAIHAQSPNPYLYTINNNTQSPYPTQVEQQQQFNYSITYSHSIMDKIRQYQRVFDHFDNNGDGKISPAELQLCVASLGGDISIAEAEAAVLLSDSDGDGLLGIDDFARLMETGENEEEKVRDLREAFKMYEMDGSGSITAKSLKKFLVKLGDSRTVDECSSMIARFDLNGDGVLNFDEFRVMMA